MSAAGQTLADTQNEVMFRELRFQVADTDLPFLNSTPGVQLAVLDTYPSTSNFPPGAASCNSGHGHAIARIARELTCDGTAGSFGRCAATITTRLALPQKAQGTDPCGHYGSPTDLATAILEEVIGWNSAATTPHLILNLSVGWDSKLLHQIPYGEGTDRLNAEELAVYYALGYAAQKQVLAIAAAGNGHGGPEPEMGALLPAGWYANTQPLPYSFSPKPPWPAPVIWPIGAVDRHGYRLGNSRPGAEPPLVAYGDHAVVPFGANLWTEPLTGSSVAAAVASSFAAIVWNLQPKLQPSQVMALLERSGAPLGRDAEFYRPAGATDEPSDSQFNQRRGRPFPSAPPPPVRRLLLNSALSRAWSAPTAADQDPKFNPNVLNCAPVHQFAQSSSSVDFACNSAYSSLPETALPSLSSLISPSLQFQPLAAVPWVQTQPEANACPSCSLGGGGGGYGNRMMEGSNPPPSSKSIDLLLEIPADWGPNASLTNLWLEAEGPPGQKRRVFISGENPISGSLRIINLPLRPETETARLSASVKVGNKTFSLRMPIYVDPGR